MQFECRDTRRLSLNSYRTPRGSHRDIQARMLDEEDEPPPTVKNLATSTEGSFELSRHPLIKDLLPLEYGFKLLSWTYVVRTFSNLVGPSLYLGLSMYGYDLINMLGFYLTGQSEVAGEGESSSFGLTVFFNSILIFGFFYSIDEKIGVASALAFGANKYDEVKRAFWQGILTVSLLVILYFCPVVIYSESLFIAIGIEAQTAYNCSVLLLKMLPVDILRMYNECVMTFVLAQGVQNRFGLIATINIAVSLITGLVAHWWLDWGVEAWLLCRVVHEIIVLMMVLPPFLYKIDPRTRGFISFMELMKGFSGFITDCGKFVVSLYSEWLGCEVAIYFTSLTQDKRQISAHTAMANIAYFIINAGIGFSVVGRTRVNVLLGKGYRNTAKNFFVLFIVGCLCLGAFFSGLLMVFKPLLVSIYAGNNPEVAELLGRLLTIYAVFLPLDFIFPFLFTVCRSTKQVMLSIMLNVVLLIGYCAFMDYYLVQVMHKSCRELVINMYLTILAIFALLLTRLFKLDWNKIIVEYDDELELE